MRVGILGQVFELEFLGQGVGITSGGEGVRVYSRSGENGLGQGLCQVGVFNRFWFGGWGLSISPKLNQVFVSSYINKIRNRKRNQMRNRNMLQLCLVNMTLYKAMLMKSMYGFRSI